MVYYTCNFCGHFFEQGPPPVCPNCRSIFVTVTPEPPLQHNGPFAHKGTISTLPEDLSGNSSKVAQQNAHLSGESCFSPGPDPATTSDADFGTAIFNYLTTAFPRSDLETRGISPHSLDEQTRHLHKKGWVDIPGIGIIVRDGRGHCSFRSYDSVHFYNPIDPLSPPDRGDYSESINPRRHFVIEERETLFRDPVFPKPASPAPTFAGALNALYFPYMEISNMSTLKNLVLYLDTIFVITPDDDFYTYRDKPHTSIISPHHDYFYSHEVVFKNPFSPFVRGIHPDWFLNPAYKSVVRDNILDDRRNKKICELASRRTRAHWSLHPTKSRLFPEDIYKAHNFTFPFLEGESYLLTLSLLACVRFNLVPVTDDPVHFHFLLIDWKAYRGN